MQTLSPPAPQPLERALHNAAARADLAACRQQLSNGSRTFLAASLLLPRRVREPACALYAFCRAADDAVDEPGARSDAVERLRARLARVYQGRPMPLAADRALAHVVARFDIPHSAAGDLASNQELAKQRAFAVRDALQAAGIEPERVLLEKPIQTEANAAGEDPKARRVEIAVK